MNSVSCREDASGLDVILSPREQTAFAKHQLSAGDSSVQSPSSVQADACLFRSKLVSSVVGEEAGLLASRTGPQQNHRGVGLSSDPWPLWPLRRWGALDA